jgi:hypothetical protein
MMRISIILYNFLLYAMLALWILASAQRGVRAAFLGRDREELAYYDAVRWSYLCGKAEDRGIQEGYKLGRSVVNHPRVTSHVPGFSTLPSNRETRFNYVGEDRFVGCGWDACVFRVSSIPAGSGQDNR